MARTRRYRCLSEQLARFATRAIRLARSRQREIAGVLVERDRLIQLLELPNVARRMGGFDIRRRDIYRAEQAAKALGAAVCGTFHSHVVSEASPGPRDRGEAHEGSLMLIYDTIGREWCLWRIRHGRAYRLGLDHL
jgi:hypothetical protein